MSALGRAVDVVVQAASAVRGERVIHAKGQAFTGQLTLLPAAAGLSVPLVRGPKTRPVLVRLSRGVGLPGFLPDVLGIAVRIPDADGAGHPQDLMLATGGGSPLLRRLLVPRRDYESATYSSLISYDVGGRDLVMAALPRDGHFLLATAEGSGAWTPFARLTIGPAVAEAQSRSLGFSIRNDAGGFVVGGAWRDARGGAYAAARSVEQPGS